VSLHNVTWQLCTEVFKILHGIYDTAISCIAGIAVSPHIDAVMHSRSYCRLGTINFMCIVLHCISEGIILHLEPDRRTRGQSLKLVTQHCKMEIRRIIVSQSEWSSHGIRNLNLLCHPLLFGDV